MAVSSNSYDHNRTGNAYVDGVLSGWHWDRTTLNYTFPQTASAYATDYGGHSEPLFGFQPVSAQMQKATREFIHGTSDAGTPWMRLTPIEGFTNLVFTETTSGYADTEIMIAHSTKGNPTAHAYYPITVQDFRAGDVWFGDSVDVNYLRRNPLIGTWGYKAAMHEFAHALGLKHGDAVDEPEDVALPLDKDFLEYSVMTTHYAPEVEPSSLAATETYRFHYPQTYMMLDIAGLQHLYGANYTFRAANTVYTWSPDTGEAIVDGVAQGRPGGGDVTDASANKILETIWDGGGTDTYDLSAYATNLKIDLNPGAYSTFSEPQRTWLGSLNEESYTARGNVYNALLANDDPRSLIENAVGGRGDDTIRGNQGINVLRGYAGQDTMEGRAGNDILDGGDGTDTAVFSGAFANYVMTHQTDGTFLVADQRTDGDGEDKLVSVRVAKFADRTIVLGGNTAPTAVILSKSNVNENAPLNKVIGVLSGEDPEGDSLTYRLTSNPGDYFRIDGDKLVLAKKLDYEDAHQHVITVEGTDVGGLTTTTTFTIDVGDVVERPPATVLLSTVSIAETTPVGAVVGKVSAYDPDGDKLTFRVEDDGGGTFSLQGDNLVLAKPLDYESRTSYGIDISATDPDGLFCKAHFVIGVEDRLEATDPANTGTPHPTTTPRILRGTKARDHLSGGGGNDTLYGGLSNDVLAGGAGNDVFIFDSRLDGKKNVDRIVDFHVPSDTINLARTVFKTVGKAGTLKKDAFWIGAKAHDASDRILYDSKSGVVAYDADGTGAKAAVKFAVVNKHLHLTSHDFHIV
ncbi:cadherin domain-containing protein [Microvirga antarctica]|uniref:cadherin domain-containing protein n=1 Tax=Microvirga antarctica TaxID=2819233 RepID=UPI001B31144B|nr:cadherin domain-containing protein [Microvirga antarctica]